MIARRRGTTLAELAVALLIAGSVAAIGAGVLVAAERRSRRDGDAARAGQTTRDVMHTLGAEIASARWGSLVVRGDTALDLHSHVGASVVCAADAELLVLPPARTSLVEAWTAWRYPPEPGDIAAVWDTSGIWRLSTIDSVSSTIGGGCAAGGAFRSVADSAAGEPLTRMRLSGPLPSAPPASSPVRIYRALRWTLYRGGDRLWWLGQRRCSGANCGAAQPVAGPLAPPADSGLRFAAWGDGRVVVRVRPRGAAASARADLTVRGAPRVSP